MAPSLILFRRTRIPKFWQLQLEKRKTEKKKETTVILHPDTTPNTRPEPKRRERDECEIIPNTVTQQHNNNTKECDIITNQHTHNKPIQNTSEENKETSKDRKNKNLTPTARDNQGKQQEDKTHRERDRKGKRSERERERGEKEGSCCTMFGNPLRRLC